jgi:predicted O-methyltransferase YrrM
MNLPELAHNWDQLGQRDAMWSILTLPGTRGNRWKQAAFFRTGDEEVQRLLRHLDELGVPPRTGRALDFGCGIGRITQALARRFGSVDGVDIAPSMIVQARRLSRHSPGCVYHVNDRPDLAIFPDRSFDLVYSIYVLQHMEPRYSRRYLEEFVRLLAPGGLAVFQLPTAPRSGQSAPMPTEAFRASVELLRAPRRLPPGGTGSARVRVRNTSPEVWPMRGTDGWYQVSVGGSWRASGGGELAGPESRSALQADLAPGEEQTVELDVMAPQAPGVYVLEVDLVQEGVAWFQDHGTSPARATVRVGDPKWAAARRTHRPATPDEPVMEMYAVPQTDVLEWVEAAGGRVVDVGEILAAGREFLLRDWDSALYVVTRAD